MTTAAQDCRFGEYRCVEQVLQVCTDGAWTDKETCDPLMGLTCDPSGYCAGACAFLGPSYVGCEYYLVSTGNDPAAYIESDFAVGVVNAGQVPVGVTITYDGDVLVEQMIPGEGASVIPLPHLSDLTDASDTILLPGGAFRLRSTSPITAYQFNPLQVSTSNDASVLLPSNTWGQNYVIASWQHWNAFNAPGLFAVVARENDTSVMLIPPGTGTLTDPVEGIDEQGHGQVLLHAGDVLQVRTRKDGELNGDFTGMQVVADKPVQVISGHQCTAIPSESFACDHLEESMLPSEALGRTYPVIPPVQWPNSDLTKAIFVRIVAAEPDASLTFTPEQNAPTYLAAVGDYVEIGPVTDAFIVSSNRRLAVAEYMVSQEFGYGTSDPSMLLATPLEQQRSEYIFYADPSWLANFADVVAPLGTKVQLDGVDVPPLSPIGLSEFGVARVKLSNAGDGAHRVVADQEFGISVYGVGDYGSYWYPGGLDVGAIPR